MSDIQNSRTNSIEDQIKVTLYYKGQIDSVITNMSKDDKNYGIYTWFQIIIEENLKLIQLLQTENGTNKARITRLEKLMFKILGIDQTLPNKELLDRADGLGDFYKELRKRSKGVEP